MNWRRYEYNKTYINCTYNFRLKVTCYKVHPYHSCRESSQTIRDQHERHDALRGRRQSGVRRRPWGSADLAGNDNELVNLSKSCNYISNRFIILMFRIFTAPCLVSAPLCPAQDARCCWRTWHTAPRTTTILNIFARLVSDSLDHSCGMV